MLVAGKVHVIGRLRWRQNGTILKLDEATQCSSGSLDASNLFAASFAIVLLTVHLLCERSGRVGDDVFGVVYFEMICWAHALQKENAHLCLGNGNDIFFVYGKLH